MVTSGLTKKDAILSGMAGAATVGVLAGVSALLLPQHPYAPPRRDLLSYRVMSIARYLAGGVAAAWTARCLVMKRAEHTRDFVGGY